MLRFVMSTLYEDHYLRMMKIGRGLHQSYALRMGVSYLNPREIKTRILPRYYQHRKGSI
jgi:hypothetical protein